MERRKKQKWRLGEVWLIKHIIPLGRELDLDKKGPPPPSCGEKWEMWVHFAVMLGFFLYIWESFMGLRSPVRNSPADNPTPHFKFTSQIPTSGTPGRKFNSERF